MTSFFNIKNTCKKVKISAKVVSGMDCPCWNGFKSHITKYIHTNEIY